MYFIDVSCISHTSSFSFLYCQFFVELLTQITINFIQLISKSNAS